MTSFKEFLCEWSHTDLGVDAHMIKLGYKELGSGVDQTAWMKPGEETIIKIFGTAEDKSKRQKFTKNHLMFKWWAEYCKKNESNPFLPKFVGWEAFEHKGEKYLQIRMERLDKLPFDIGHALENSLAFWAVQKSEFERQAGLHRIKNFKDDSYQNEGIAQLMMLLGEEHFDLLFKTISDLAKVGRKNGWGIDLHKGNFMFRNDGTPVIVDPFVV